MLIRDDGDSWTAIGQPAHAWLAGQVAQAWAPRLDDDVVLAIEQHDVPWMGWDRRPPLHAEGRRAAAFFEAPAGPRLELWRHAADRLVAQSPYAALVVSLHATNIHTRYAEPSARPEAFLAEQRADQDRLLGLLAREGITRELAEHDADLLFCLDALSLTLCHGWPARELPSFDGRTIRVEPTAPDEATLDPWPLTPNELTVSVHARRFTERFDDEAALHDALDAAVYHRLTWRLRPAERGSQHLAREPGAASGHPGSALRVATINSTDPHLRR